MYPIIAQIGPLTLRSWGLLVGIPSLIIKSKKG